jgi:hypothetical protein
MTDLDQTADRLRAALDELVADVPAVRNQPALLHPATMVIEGRRWSRQRSLATITVAVVVATVVAAVVYYGPRSGPTGPTVSKQAGRHTGALASPPGWINLPFLLPTGNAIVDSAMVASGPVPVPSNGTYEQAYEGPQTTDSPQLLITTVQAQPGAIADYAAGSQAVSVNGGVAYLTSFQDHQLLWQTPDGVVVSLESKGMSSSDVVAAAQLVEPHPSSQLGVDLSGTLPDGLVPVGEGFASGDTAQNQGDTIFFNYGRCHAYTQLWAGSPADFAAVAIVSDSYRSRVRQGDPRPAGRDLTEHLGVAVARGTGDRRPAPGRGLRPDEHRRRFEGGRPRGRGGLEDVLAGQAQAHVVHSAGSGAGIGARPGAGTFGLAH